MRHPHYLGTIFFSLFTALSACSHTTHVAATDDGKSAWIAHDFMFLFIINSEKFFCSKGDSKLDRPTCLRAVEK